MSPSEPERLARPDWASQIAEHLPEADVLQLASATARGLGAVRTLRAQATGPLLRDACDRLIKRLQTEEPAFAAGALAGAATAVRRGRAHQSIDVVWTGPESGIATARLTAATILGLAQAARHSILLVSFATQTVTGLNSVLADAYRHGVEITLVMDRNADNPAYHGSDNPFPAIAATRLYWPAGNRPPGASLHAKVLVVDNETALVTSANFTSPAMQANLECGILIRGGPQPRAIRGHIDALWSRGDLRRL